MTADTSSDPSRTPPPPVFDESGEVEETIAAALDPEFYRAQLPRAERDGDPVRHYMAVGHDAGLRPTPEFDTAFYLSRSPDVVEAGMNGFFHYLRWGRPEGRAPSQAAVEWATRPVSAAERLIAPHVDADFYRAHYPEVARTHVVPFKHYLHFGWHAGLDPSAEFSTNFYRAAPYETDAHENPLHHYIRIGHARGRLPRPLPAGDEAEALRAEFDAAFYRAAYPGACSEGTDPVRDYAERGWRAGRDPTPWFSTGDYLARFPEVATTGTNPFLHYLLWGRAQGFPPALGEGVTAVPARELHRVSAELLPLLSPTATPGPASGVEPKRLNLHWVIPEVEGPGRGGHMTIFRIIRWLEAFGHRCTVWVNDPGPAWTDAARSELIQRSYQAIAAPVGILPNAPAFPPDAVVVATSWTTALVVDAMASARSRFYFVQDDERLFHPMGARALAADRTYRLDMGYLCAGSWLAETLAREHGRWARAFDLAPDARQHPPTAAPANPRPRIAFYARAHTDRRTVELGFMALQRLAEMGVDFEAHLFGSDQPLEQAPFPAVDHGMLEPEELAELYRRCDLGLCFSATNPSLIPAEMMACGLPVVELDAPGNRAVLSPAVATLASPDPDAVATALQKLLNDGGARRAQAEQALAWVAGRSWEASARAVEGAILERLAERGVTMAAAAPSAPAERPVATVVIPTLNGGALFRRVLDRVLEQRTPWPFEVVVADSQSDDGTWEFLQTRPAVRAFSVPRTDFQHGRTRNLAAGHGSGEFIAFLTQDALPADRLWLGDLVGGLQRRPRAAGAFGRHLPQPEASPFTRRDLHGFFRHLGSQPLERSKFIDLERWRAGEEGFRRELHFFSNNNSCLRRSVWEGTPLPEVDYGEDQLWAARVLGQRYALAYVPTACVVHSHEYDEASRFERSRVEGRWFLDSFGYRAAPADPEQQIARMNIGDERWGVRNGVPRHLIEAKKRLNRAEIEGLVAGQAEAESRR